MGSGFGALFRFRAPCSGLWTDPGLKSIEFLGGVESSSFEVEGCLGASRVGLGFRGYGFRV